MTKHDQTATTLNSSKATLDLGKDTTEVIHIYFHSRLHVADRVLLDYHLLSDFKHHDSKAVPPKATQ